MPNDIIGESLSGVIPEFSLSGVLGSVGIFLIILVVGAILAVFSVWLINYLKYNKKIKLFRRVGNQVVPVLIDRAMFERVGSAGDYWCKLKKFKKIIPRPRIQMAKNEFWFYERDDGEWINFSLADFDEQLKMAKVHYIDEDMRLQRLGIQKNLRDRFQKVTFWEKYGGMMMSLGFIIVVSIMFIVLAKEWVDAIQTTQTMADAIREMAIQVQNLKGSGAVPVAVGGFVIPMFKKKRKN